MPARHTRNLHLLIEVHTGGGLAPQGHTIDEKGGFEMAERPRRERRQPSIEFDGADARQVHILIEALVVPGTDGFADLSEQDGRQGAVGAPRVGAIRVEGCVVHMPPTLGQRAWIRCTHVSGFEARILNLRSVHAGPHQEGQNSHTPHRRATSLPFHGGHNARTSHSITSVGLSASHRSGRNTARQAEGGRCPQMYYAPNYQRQKQWEGRITTAFPDAQRRWGAANCRTFRARQSAMWLRRHFFGLICWHF